MSSEKKITRFTDKDDIREIQSNVRINIKLIHEKSKMKIELSVRKYSVGSYKQSIKFTHMTTGDSIKSSAIAILISSLFVFCFIMVQWIKNILRYLSLQRNCQNLIIN
ncbi:unnamed protein product [Paramecium sonneborni]|uniref:Uncharacterized protein n=1 Tax=Paramecium sonneborni TaxID=65129 RepID=A0A8S1LB62_9CILI|nr:unnamed protein product [Paramecium sonneborni]